MLNLIQFTWMALVMETKLEQNWLPCLLEKPILDFFYFRETKDFFLKKKEKTVLDYIYFRKNWDFFLYKKNTFGFYLF